MDILDWLFGSPQQKEQLIQDASIRREQDYTRVNIDLSTARNNQKISVRGLKIDVCKFTGGNQTTTMRLNNPNAQELYPEELRNIIIPFTDIYITNTAQQDKALTLLISNSPYGANSARSVALSADGLDLATDANLDTLNTRFTSHTLSSGTKTSGDAASAVSATADKYRNVVIQCSTYDVYIGDSSSQPILIEVGDSIGFDFCDLSELYVKNATGGQNGVLNFIGVSEK